MRAACRLLAPEDRKVHVLYVAPQAHAPKSGRISHGSYQRVVAEETKRVLAEAKQILTEEGVDGLTLSETGSPAGIIMHEAAEYDLTVIGAKGRETRAEIGLGPVASRLVEHATGCVLVGREPPSEKGMRILVPVDGSDSANDALDTLNSFFDLESADITLLHVIETMWLPQDPDEEPATSEFSKELRREAEQLLAEARTRVLEHHPGVTTLVRGGTPANEILSEADQGEYDLVVVGAGGATDMKHSILGSVSTKIAWNAPCSVLVVRVPE